MGFFSSLFGRPKRTINVDHGLSYRVVNPFMVEVLISPHWQESCGQAQDMRKPQRQTLSDIKKFNAVAMCGTESEAWAVLQVLEQMDHFCERCGDEAYPWKKKCDACGSTLWKGKKPIQMAVVREPPQAAT